MSPIPVVHTFSYTNLAQAKFRRPRLRPHSGAAYRPDRYGERPDRRAPAGESKVQVA